MQRERAIRWPVLILTCVIMAVLAWVGQHRLHIDTDITATVPDGNVAFSSAKRVLDRHPALDRVVIDLSTSDGRPDARGLTEAANALVTALEQSGLFSSVGTTDAVRGLATLFTSVPNNLPALFTSDELEREVAPLLTPEAVENKIATTAASLSELSGVGSVSRIGSDPLSLSDLAFKRLGALTPSDDARIEHGHIIKNDDRHLLVSAAPRITTMDTTQAHAIDELVRRVDQTFRDAKPGEPGAGVVVTSVGGYRAAIDNETMIKHDANFAIAAATLGIAVLLLLCFPRPWLGIFALLPAMAGGCMALFAYSFIESDVSALGLGFGGALVSITVDQGVVYLLFIDRESRTRGRRAAHEVFRIGSLSTLINIGSFLALWFSGFRVLGQLGLFAALGIGFSFLFVHLVFPLIFPSVPPAPRPAWLPIDRWLQRITVGRGFRALAVAGVLFVAALAFARPTFSVDLAAMNSVSKPTANAEAHFKNVWGNIFDGAYVLLDAPDPDSFQRQSDRWLTLLEQQKSQHVITRAFSPSMLTPGQDVAAARGKAWAAFWSPERIASLERSLRDSGERHGFANDAFAPFLKQIRARSASAAPLPESVMALYATSPGRDGTGVVWLSSVVKGPDYDANAFAGRVHEAGLHVFDGAHFSRTLADFLGQSFGRMLLIIVAFVSLCVLIFFLDIRVALVALAPLAFAFVCTLAALRLLGHPIDVPGLMLAILVFGMGVDYSFSFVRVYQSSLGEHHPSHGPVRTSVFLASSAALVGMLTLTTAQHSVARSAGITASIAIAMCAIGAFVILPPLLRRMYAPRPLAPANPRAASAWVMARFRLLSAYPRLHAWFKLRLDPMFPRLEELVPTSGTVLDLGCGYGIPAAWLMAHSEERRIVGIEADEERACTAQWVLGERGVVHVGIVPDRWGPEGLSAILCLDMVHYLTDEQLGTLLSRASESLEPDGKLVMRATVPLHERPSIYRWMEQRRLALRGHRARFRSVEWLRERMEEAGLRVVLVEPTASGREETWLVAVRAADAR